MFENDSTIAIFHVAWKRNALQITFFSLIYKPMCGSYEPEKRGEWAIGRIWNDERMELLELLMQQQQNICRLQVFNLELDHKVKLNLFKWVSWRHNSSRSSRAQMQQYFNRITG